MFVLTAAGGDISPLASCYQTVLQCFLDKRDARRPSWPRRTTWRCPPGAHRRRDLCLSPLCALSTSPGVSYVLDASHRWERLVRREFSDGRWRQSFQMMRRSFDKLCGIMEGVSSPQDVTVGAAVPLQMRADIFFVQPRAECGVVSLVFTGGEVRVLLPQRDGVSFETN